MLGNEIKNAKVLITVKTYPMPTPSYEEIVCTAGLTENGDWIRIYPIPYRDLPFREQFKKYEWIKLNLLKRTSDFRRESYSPAMMYDEEITIVGSVDTKNNWRRRKEIILKNVYDSFDELIVLAKTEYLSLGIIKPKEILGFEIERDDRDWPEEYSKRLEQYKLFENVNNRRSLIRKLPYKYYYKFLTTDNKVRRLQIFDWEIGALFWNCLENRENDESAANDMVRFKYFDDFVINKDLYLFVGTSYRHHKMMVDNPFSIIGIFYPPIETQPTLI